MMNFGNMGKMMKQVQKMQEDMQRMQEEMANRTVEATAGGGAVRVVVTGKQEVREVHIAPEAIDPADKEMLEDLLVTVLNEALRRSQEMVAEEMGKVTGNMKLPPGLL